MTLDPDALCPVCGDSGARLRYRLSRFRVYDCAACGLIYIWPQLPESTVREMFSRLYSEGKGSLPELETYYDFTYEDAPDNPLVRRYEQWLDAIEAQRPPGRILDVGCGTGLFLAVARRRGWEPHGVDACTDATAYARNHFGLGVWDGEFSDFSSSQTRFDAITLWDVIEHTRDPVALLRTASQQLAPGGVVGISTPNQHSILDVVAGGIYRFSGSRIALPLEKFYIDQHFLYFSEPTLRDTLRRAGLEVTRLRRELTDLRRLSLSPPVRALLQTLFAFARISGLENRLFALARPTQAR